MITCPSCGTETRTGRSSGNECGVSLANPSPIAEERRVVTTLFCDLLGSTAMGEAADPEDVDAMLRRYSALARKVVENHGGTVEEFIDDAVVAVFGVPVTHEDDPERAVRAGLRLVETIEDLSPVADHAIQVRIGINTGEALVRLDVAPGSGEGFLTGDAVNVGARLQSAAPPMGVVVGALAHELTRKAIVYEALEPVAAKGKRELLEAWLAEEFVARTVLRTRGDVRTPLVGLMITGVSLDVASAYAALSDEFTPDPDTVRALGMAGSVLALTGLMAAGCARGAADTAAPPPAQGAPAPEAARTPPTATSG